MPYYKNIIETEGRSAKRIFKKIKELRAQLKTDLPEKTHSKNILFATWNIRDFDKPSYNTRLEESYYYIAEIISHFDIVAVQEVYRDLTALKKLMYILGSDYDVIFSDTTEGRRGNDERMAYIFDCRKVKFGGLSGEMVLPPIETKVRGKTKYTHVGQIWRTPMICGFQVGWAKFLLCSVHIQWGSSTANSKERIEEISHVAKFLKKRTEDPTSWARKIILLGDFNIFNNRDKTYKSLTDEGFSSPDILKNSYTNLAKKKRQYDQILLRERKDRFEVVNGGVFDFSKSLFKPEEEKTYKNKMVKKKKKATDKTEYYSNYKNWATHQISDHLPLWLEMKIDYTDDYLQYLIDK